MTGTNLSPLCILKQADVVNPSIILISQMWKWRQNTLSSLSLVTHLYAQTGSRSCGLTLNIALPTLAQTLIEARALNSEQRQPPHKAYGLLSGTLTCGY